MFFLYLCIMKILNKEIKPFKLVKITNYRSFSFQRDYILAFLTNQTRKRGKDYIEVYSPFIVNLDGEFLTEEDEQFVGIRTRNMIVKPNIGDYLQTGQELKSKTFFKEKNMVFNKKTMKKCLKKHYFLF